MPFNASPTSSADVPQLPATIVVTPIRTKFSARGCFREVVGMRVHVDEARRDDEPGASMTVAGVGPCDLPIAAMRPLFIATSPRVRGAPDPFTTMPPTMARS